MQNEAGPSFRFYNSMIVMCDRELKPIPYTRSRQHYVDGFTLAKQQGRFHVQPDKPQDAKGILRFFG